MINRILNDTPENKLLYNDRKEFDLYIYAYALNENVGKFIDYEINVTDKDIKKDLLKKIPKSYYGPIRRFLRSAFKFIGLAFGVLVRKKDEK